MMNRETMIGLPPREQREAELGNNVTIYGYKTVYEVGFVQAELLRVGIDSAVEDTVHNISATNGKGPVLARLFDAVDPLPLAERDIVISTLFVDNPYITRSVDTGELVLGGRVFPVNISDENVFRAGKRIGGRKFRAERFGQIASAIDSIHEAGYSPKEFGFKNVYYAPDTRNEARFVGLEGLAKMGTNGTIPEKQIEIDRVRLVSMAIEWLADSDTIIKHLENRKLLDLDEGLRVIEVATGVESEVFERVLAGKYCSCAEIAEDIQNSVACGKKA